MNFCPGEEGGRGKREHGIFSKMGCPKGQEGGFAAGNEVRQDSRFNDSRIEAWTIEEWKIGKMNEISGVPRKWQDGRKAPPPCGGAFAWNHFLFFMGYDIIKIESGISFSII